MIADRKETVMKSSAPKKIAKIQFGTMDALEVRLASVVQVSNREVFQMPLRNAAPHGCMDPRLGISDKQSACQTCKKKLTDCSGHFGHIQLELPVFHPGYFKHVVVLLQCICKQCARVLLPMEERRSMLKRLRSSIQQQGHVGSGSSAINNRLPAQRIDALTRGAMFKRAVDLCKRNGRCHFCGYSNGVVKKVGSGCFKIVHEKFRAKGADDQVDRHRLTVVQEIAKQHPELVPALTKSVDLLNPLRAYELLCRMTEEDLALVWMQGDFGRPESLIMWSVPVPPVPIRPSVPQELGGGSTEDDITIKLQEIIEMNNALRMALEKGATMKMVAEDWEFLQVQVALFINGETPGIPRQLLGTGPGGGGAKPIRGLCQRLKGKQGRFRGNLSGKRVDFSGRTVISPDPNLRVDQVGVPVLVARTMTYPEKVNRYNLERMRQAVRNGPEVHPGANIVRVCSGVNSSKGVSIASAGTSGAGGGGIGGGDFSSYHVKALQYADKELTARGLQVGDIVERHMRDGDIVLFNRQPSLHKMSIMAHEVKVMPWRTFRFNECACTPYNADFDGDEMNMHLPQTEEARAEAADLMIITNNLVTPRNGEPLVAATQDFLTGAFLLTQKDVFLTRADFCRLVAYFSDAAEHIDMPAPAIRKPHALWTGKQVMTMLVSPNLASRCPVNIESEERFYTNGTRHFCPQDGFVSFHRGELICGNIGKKTLGGDTKSGLFYVLIRDFGALQATRCMNRLAKLCARYLGERGFSIGIDDVTPSPTMQSLKKKILADGQRQADAEIEAYKAGKIKLKPGCDALQSLESEVNGLLGKIRESCGKEALIALNHRNAPLTMAQCGSKGSALNISQMVACLGQQSVGGARIQNGFVNRTLPHFPVDALFPAAKGFVANSFFSGLTATEFFFHTMGGREGLVDTAVKTAETGYMARRLMKALEDLSMQYDTTVRNSEQSVVQFQYGDDGLNPQVMEKFDRPVDFARLLVNSFVPPENAAAAAAAAAAVVATGCTDTESTGNNLRFEAETKALQAQQAQAQDSLSSSEIVAIVESELRSPRFSALLPLGRQFLEEIAGFFNVVALHLRSLETLALPLLTPAAPPSAPATTKSHVATTTTTHVSEKIVQDDRLRASHVRRRVAEMTPEQRAQWRLATRVPHSMAFKEAHCLMCDNAYRITELQLRRVLDQSLQKYLRSMVEPGEAVGAVGAQSLSEPGTQMTLKTFHFAGVASMNVTLGVPRLKEIINASSFISTPIIEARLVQEDSMTSARIVKAQIEKTTLGEIALYIKEVHHCNQSYVSVKLDMERIRNLHLSVNAQTVKWALLHNYAGIVRPAVLRMLKDKHVLIYGRHCDKLKILPPDAKDSGKGVPAHQKVYFVIQSLKAVVPDVIVQGIPSVSRAVINEEAAPSAGKGKGSGGGGVKDKLYYLLVEGYGLSEVMGQPGVDGRQTKSNHIVEMQRVLGIEAARSMIASEISYIMQAYGITVDKRHLMLLSDVMTFKGEVLGITRFGVAKMKESVLMLASFEKTTDHLFDAAVHSREDEISGVSECIIMGVPIPIGTGIFKLLHVPKDKITLQRRTRLLDRV